MKTTISAFFILILCSLVSACDNKVGQLPNIDEVLAVQPDIYPDYKDIVIPSNIAPLHFALCQESDDAMVRIHFEGKDMVYRVENGNFMCDTDDWKQLMKESRGKTLKVSVLIHKDGKWKSYAPFDWVVSTDEADQFIAYRLIPPGYEYWNEMGIYQRDISSFKESVVINNHYTKNNCMNCHSFCMQNPNKFMFHMRGKLGGTYHIDNGEVEKIVGKVSKKIQGLVYPSWHPSGRYIAFSTNDIFQTFHLSDKNRVEVYDKSSGVIVYDVQRHEVVTATQLMSDDRFETFPTFSPDGKRLFFCSAASKDMPKDLKKVQYSLCSISFDAEKGTFGTQVDTLFNARQQNKSASFPRVSPDNKYLVFTVADYGQFTIWHKEADLYVADLTQNTTRRMENINSDDVESYHSWSSNGRWLVFSSRREDGLYTKPYFSHIDENGKASKPFLLPQATPDFYKSFMFSYNIPEFVKGEITVNPIDIVRTAEGEGKKVTLR